MHSAPAVSYPVGRSALHGGLLLSVIIIGTGTVFAWVEQVDFIEGRHVGAMLLLLLGSIFSLVRWHRSPVGTLAWDGQIWTWTCQDVSITVNVAVSFDSQSALLLYLQMPQRHVWVWPERGMAAARWLALRRAVFAPNPANKNHSSSEKVH